MVYSKLNYEVSSDLRKTLFESCRKHRKLGREISCENEKYIQIEEDTSRKCAAACL